MSETNMNKPFAAIRERLVRVKNEEASVQGLLDRAVMLNYETDIARLLAALDVAVEALKLAQAMWITGCYKDTVIPEALKKIEELDK